MGFLSSTVGSFPRSSPLLRARWQLSEEEIELSEFGKIEGQSIQTTISLQESLGLDLLVDGQLDRSDMVSHFAERIPGMESGALVRCYGNRYYRRPKIVGVISRDEPITVDSFKAAQRLTSSPVKAILTGPYTLMDWSFDEHYGLREAACNALAEVIAAEAQDLVAAGAREIQIDEPAISGRPGEIKMIEQAQRKVNDAIGGKARHWLHVAHGELKPVMGAVLNLPVDGLLIGMAHARYECIDSLVDLPPDKLLGVGVIDAVCGDVESVDQVRERIDRILKKVPAERFCLIPDAGLRALTGEQAEAKLRTMLEAGASF